MANSDLEVMFSLPDNPALHECMGIISRGCGKLFTSSDPGGKQLGSGGGTAWLLAEAWRKAVKNGRSPLGFGEWLKSKPRLMVHGSGESRRLPAYAPAGKPLITVPELHGVPGQYPVQHLFNMQCHAFRSILGQVPDCYCLMTCCGDTLIVNRSYLPGIPEADVLIFGLPVAPEEASRHGVLVTRHGRSGMIDRFLQKPSVEKLNQLDKWETYTLDSGIWLFSLKAVKVLLQKCGWDFERSDFKNGFPEKYNIYNEFGKALGKNPENPDPELGCLTSAVVSLDQASFYHFGTSRSLLVSVNQLSSQSSRKDFNRVGPDRRKASPVILHSDVGCQLTNANRWIWIDNSVVPAEWNLSEKHVLTNIPANNWKLVLPPGSCLDFQYIDGSWCIRNYGFDDSFSGTMDLEETGWMGGRARAWLDVRGLNLEDAGIEASCDILDADLFPLVDLVKVSGEFIQWLIDKDPQASEVLRKQWLESPRVSGRDLLHRADFRRNWDVRQGRLEKEVREGKRKFNLDSYDLGEVAEMTGSSGFPEAYNGLENGLEKIRFRMLLSESARVNKNPEEADNQDREAFSGLRKLLIDQVRTEPQSPGRNVQEDQIVWARSPVRFDLAGGWTDTPPYCLYHGGRVVNLAADLNEQSPIQVFARISKEPRILLRSLDLGLDKKIETFEELLARGRLGGGFGIARACLELAGFSPEFHVQSRFSSLRQMLETSMGGGIELSMVAALPKGSGLGTSSILATTILGTLSELCGLNWSKNDIYTRTLAVEQMMNLGGGWQDQIGGLYGGIKLIESEPGLEQRVSIRTLPDGCFDQSRANVTVLLYYTGITRIAHGILEGVVRGVFLNKGEHMRCLHDIGMNALFTSDALQKGDMDLVCEAVRRGWKLKQDLDPGTNPPEVSSIIESIKPYTRACTLSGAGGGGYLLIFAGNVHDAEKIRVQLTSNPPNNKARFVDFQLSQQGFQVSRS